MGKSDPVLGPRGIYRLTALFPVYDLPSGLADSEDADIEDWAVNRVAQALGIRRMGPLESDIAGVTLMPGGVAIVVTDFEALASEDPEEIAHEALFRAQAWGFWEPVSRGKAYGGE